MLIYKCDSCQKEITTMPEAGEFKIQQKTLGFFKHQKQDQLSARVYLLCVECSVKLEEYLKDLAKTK